MAECLRRAGVPEHLTERWLALDEVFRKQIVKKKPAPKKIRGLSLPLGGYEEMELAVGACCDGCQVIMEPGDRAKYHQRTGQMYCGSCMTDLQLVRASQRPPR
jgi:hypothetical protein